MNVRFGPAGNSDSFYREGFKSSLDMPLWLKNRGLNAYEYQCSRGVNIGEETARRLGELAEQNGVFLSIHAPYYINLAADDPDMRAKTRKHLFSSLQAARWMGAGVVVFHPGSAKNDRPGAMSRARKLLAEFVSQAREEGFGDILMAPETMGKKSLLGSLEEVLELCSLGEKITPAIDFGHIHAAGSGSLVSKEQFAAVLDRVEEVLGRDRLKSMHFHFSPVEFTAAGEKRHRTTVDEGYGPDFEPLAQLLAERSSGFTLICESDGRQAEDAIFYKAIYERVSAPVSNQ